MRTIADATPTDIIAATILNAHHGDLDNPPSNKRILELSHHPLWSKALRIAETLSLFMDQPA